MIGRRCFVSKTGGRESSWFDRKVDGSGKRALVHRLQRLDIVAARVCLVCLVFLIASGCGKYKQELESAKQQINTLSAESKRLNEALANLEKEKTRLSDELKVLSEKDSKLQQELANLSKDKAALFEENKELKKDNSSMKDEIAALKQEKSDLSKEVEDLKKLSGTGPETGTETTVPSPQATQMPGLKEQIEKPQESSNPCDAVIEYMNTGLGIVKQHKGADRKRLLEQARKEYALRMQGAPAQAVKSAEAWLAEVVRSWDSTHNDTVLSLITKRKAVLDACGKKPSDIGF